MPQKFHLYSCCGHFRGPFLNLIGFSGSLLLSVCLFHSNSRIAALIFHHAQYLSSPSLLILSTTHPPTNYVIFTFYSHLSSVKHLRSLTQSEGHLATCNCLWPMNFSIFSSALGNTRETHGNLGKTIIDAMHDGLSTRPWHRYRGTD